MKRTIAASLIVIAAATAGYFASFEIAGGITALGAREVSDAVREAPAVDVVRVQTRVFADRVSSVGTTRASQSIEVYPSLAGRVKGIDIVPGAEVKAGHVLVQLDDGSERAAVNLAQATVTETKAQFDRQDELLERSATSVALKETARGAWMRAEADLELAENILRDRRVHAAFDGVVGLTNLRIGSRVETSTLVTTLDDLHVVDVSFAVPERYFPLVKTGQRVVLRSPAYPDRVFEGEVSAIDTRIDPVSRVVSLRASIANDDRALVSGMLIDAEMTLSTRNAVAVPSHAVIKEGDASYVVVVKDSKAHRTEVVLGAMDGDEFEVRSGLDQGDVVVVSGLHLVKDGEDVRSKDAESLTQ